MTANAASRLIEHYVDNFRQLPWRTPPGGAPPDPYAVWLSEVMLQQTTVATVAPRFERFIARWPDVEALAEASDAEILGEWAGLGYYARARHLIACAREVAARGAFPDTSAELRNLPGIGAYTAAAIAAIAFGEKAPAVDTNVERVIARLDGLAHPARPEVGRRLIEMMGDEVPGDIIQALMDLGATICRPKRPHCDHCPLNDDCLARASGDAQSFPARRERKVRPHRFGVAWWIERNGQVWLVRRPAKGLLGGMAALPGTEWTDAQDWVRGSLGEVRHVFTHFSLDLMIEPRSDPVGAGWWQPIDRIDEVGLPTLYRRAVNVALQAGQQSRAAA